MHGAYAQGYVIHGFVVSPGDRKRLAAMNKLDHGSEQSVVLVFQTEDDDLRMLERVHEPDAVDERRVVVVDADRGPAVLCDFPGDLAIFGVHATPEGRSRINIHRPGPTSKRPNYEDRSRPRSIAQDCAR